MAAKITHSKAIRRLFDLRNRYGASNSAEKLCLLQQLASKRVDAATDIKRLHIALCFIRAFPDSPQHFRLARTELLRIAKRVAQLPRVERSKLRDTGIAGSSLHCQFSYEVACWLQRRAPADVSIDWSDGPDPTGLDEILAHLLQPADEEYFDSGWITGKDWVANACKESATTDFEWLLIQLKERRFASIWSSLYNAAELWLKWDLRNARLSKSLNTFPIHKVCARPNGLRKLRGLAAKEIMRPLESLTLLAPRAGSRMIDVAMASLAVRHRETNHFNHANPREVWLADVGEGVSIAIFGMLENYRYPLECTMGYLILSNGTPIGYGGASMLFLQANTGVNIFDEYRGSEAAYLWVQVMRVFHHLTGCTRFIANSYQFGADNNEALRSGAFWFYYRLGYRPVSREMRELASSSTGTRDDVKLLRRLASCDMHLTLPGARPSELFEERWLETSSMLATEVLNAAGGPTRGDAA
ncbi:MAG: hypothetical protein O2805_08285 [Proteobacteria bacterium]|nr:hypothetical protein [Pseudomonadota bacterium]